MPAFNILKCQLDMDDDRAAVYKQLKPEHKLKWLIEVDNDDLFGAEVFRKAYIGADLPAGSDPIHRFGEAYAVNDFVENAFASDYSCKLKDNDAPRIWILEVTFEGIDPSKPQKEERERRTKQNPLDWDAIYWIDQVEDQIPIEWASLLGAGEFSFNEPDEGLIVEDSREGKWHRVGLDKWFYTHRTLFSLIKRGLARDSGGDIILNNEPGPVVNTAGQQTIDPITRPRFHAKLMAQKNYSTSFECLSMNAQFYEAVNSEPFLGDPPRTWRYLISVTDKPQERDILVEGSDTPSDTSDDVTSIVTYYVTTSTLEFNPNTWDVYVLNNGMTSFRLRIKNAGDEPNNMLMNPRAEGAEETPALFPATVLELKEEAFTKFIEDPSTTLTESDYEEVPASEPVNLTPGGVMVHQITNTASALYKKSFHLQYRHYTRELDFNTIPIFAELVAEYELWIASQGT